ncbi:MAG TPA: hypothetical protein VMV69_05360 [Pirellulales bacterium]|nr:hypothetical protein [Pirellulales bacterium]
MLQNRFDWHESIKAVEREYWAVRIAVERLVESAARDPNVLGTGPKPRDLVSADENLEGTYLIRMFAKFETGVRSYWRTLKPRSRASVEILVDRVADKRSIPIDVTQGVHAVRQYRNRLVHERDQAVEHITIADARSRLATYLARLPLMWDA